MEVYIKRINAVRGFLPTTYAIFKGNELIKIVCSKKEAEEIKNSINN